MTLRSVLLVLLLLLPVAAFAGVGGYLSWRQGWFFELSLLATGCYIAAALLKFLPRRADETPPASRLADQPHWTDRDREAAAVIAAHQQRLASDPSQIQLTEPAFYLDAGRRLMADLAAIYHPGQANPWDKLAAADLLAAVRLAIEDVERWVYDAVPRPQTWTLSRLRKIQTAADYLPHLSNIWYLASAVRNPAVIFRWALAQGASKPVKEVATGEVLVTAATYFVGTLGAYLIELYAGRLRAGAEAWRSTFAAGSTRSVSQRGIVVATPPPVTIALVGQTSAGKSSLANAIVGEPVAAVDALPETDRTARYETTLGRTPIVLLDTPGYGDDGTTTAQRTAIDEALAEADVTLVVMAANSPARAADAAVLQGIEQRLTAHPMLQPPPLIGVLTKVDRLPPPLDGPPYQTEHPHTPKERTIAAAVAHVAAELRALHAVVPVVAESGRLWHIDDGLLPELIARLGQAQQVALLRGFEQAHPGERWTSILRKATRLTGQVTQAYLRQLATRTKGE